MSFAGLPRGSERADVIAYLNSKSDSPAPLPKAAEAAAGRAGRERDAVSASRGAELLRPESRAVRRFARSARRRITTP
jgi:cytochrome c